MSKVTNTTKQFADHPAFGMVLIHSGTGAIEAMEAQGQRELVNASVLPTEGLDPAVWEPMGIKIGAPVSEDVIFTQVNLPAGWRKRATDHAMWSDLIDDKDRVRGRIFCKAACYDRSAKLSPVRRFNIERDYDRSDYRSVIVIRVTDCGQVVFSSPPVTINPRDWDESDRATKDGQAACQQWLTDHGYADYKNVLAYWDVA